MAVVHFVRSSVLKVTYSLSVYLFPCVARLHSLSIGLCASSSSRQQKQQKKWTEHGNTANKHERARMGWNQANKTLDVHSEQNDERLSVCVHAHTDSRIVRVRCMHVCGSRHLRMCQDIHCRNFVTDITDAIQLQVCDLGGKQRPPTMAIWLTTRQYQLFWLRLDVQLIGYPRANRRMPLIAVNPRNVGHCCPWQQ